MAKKKNFWYILVMDNEGAFYVTDINRESKYARWNGTDKPLELGEFMAKDTALGLILNGFQAYALVSPVELKAQPYRYDKGHFEWVWDNKEEKKEVV